METIGNEFERVFRNPRQIHRVLMVIPLASLMSHLIHMYLSMPKGLPISSDSYITMVLGGILYTMVSCWVFMSNDLDFELTVRFFWAALLAVLGHRVGVMDNEVGGSVFFKSVAFLAIGTMMIFVVTGKTKNELKIWFTVKFNENGDAKKARMLHIHNNDSQSGTG